MVDRMDSRDVPGTINGASYRKMSVKEAKRVLHWKGKYGCQYCREVLLRAQKLRKAVMVQMDGNNWDGVGVVY